MADLDDGVLFFSDASLQIFLATHSVCAFLVWVNETHRAPTKIAFTRHQLNERWFCVKFDVPDFEQRLQTWGQTPEKAEAAMCEILDRRYPDGGYILVPPEEA